MKLSLLKLKLMVIPSLLLLLFSCTDNIQDCTTCPDTISEFEKEWIKNNPKQHKCGIKYDEPIRLDDVGVSIYAVSKNKNIILFFTVDQNNTYILEINGMDVKIEGFLNHSLSTKDITALNGLVNPLFCPYDNNIVVGFIVKEAIVGKDKYGSDVYKFIKELYKYNVSTKEYTKLPLNVSNEEYESITEVGIDDFLVHWSNQSTPNNDYILIKNHKRLHLQSGKLLEGYSNKTNDNNKILVSVSPDESKFISLDPNNKNGDFYVNEKVHTDKILYRSFLLNYYQKIHWSDDSKSFSTRYGIFENTAYNFYKITDENSIILSDSLDMMTLHCSTYPSGTPVFYTNSSYLITIYPNLSRRGELYEVNKKGEIIRQITKVF